MKLSAVLPGRFLALVALALFAVGWWPGAAADERAEVRRFVIEPRFVYVERMVSARGATREPQVGEEKTFRLDDPAWRRMPGAGGDPNLVTCVESFGKSLFALIDPSTGKFPAPIEDAAARLAQQSNGTVTLAIYLQRDVDLDATVDEIEEGSVRLTPGASAEVVDATGRRSTSASTTIGRVTPRQAKGPGPGLLRRQVRVETEAGSRSVTSRALGSVDYAAQNSACVVNPEGVLQILEDAIARCCPRPSPP